MILSKLYAHIEMFLLYYLELITTGKEPDFTFEVKEPEYVTLDGNNVTAQKIGETTVSC